MTNNNEILVRDITNPQEQLISYGGKQQVGFYDGFKGKGIRNAEGKVEVIQEPTLYIYINNNGDRFTTVRRRAGDRRVKNGFGDTTLVAETKLYARAYEKYLQIKGQGGQADPEKAAMIAKIAELEAKTSVKAKKAEVVEVKADKTAKDLKVELDALGVEYKGNASKEALLELLAK